MKKDPRPSHALLVCCLLTLGEKCGLAAQHPDDPGPLNALEFIVANAPSSSIGRGLYESAVGAVVRIGGVKSVPKLATALGMRSKWYERMEIISALGRIGDLRAVDRLIKAVESDRSYHLEEGWLDEALCAVAALTRITGQDFGRDVARWSAWWADQGKDTERAEGV